MNTRNMFTAAYSWIRLHRREVREGYARIAEHKRHWEEWPDFQSGELKIETTALQKWEKAYTAAEKCLPHYEEIPEYSRHVENGELFEFFRDSKAICAGPISDDEGQSEDDEGNWIGGGVSSRERLPKAIRHWWDWMKEQQV